MTKRYIEDVLPLTELNKYAQVGGGIGSLNAMHPYFARRPLTASRAMTLAALLDAPKTDADRQLYEKVLIGLCKEEWPHDSELLEQARQLIRNSHEGRSPRVLDPFAGGGSMPLEALRLGCEATALDLNPVAYLALIGSLVYPQKFGKEFSGISRQSSLIKEEQGTYSSISEDETEPVLPGLQSSIINQNSIIESQLVADVRYWAEWVLTQAEAQIGECFPHDSDGATPIAYLWAKTIPCPYCKGEIPLIKRRWLRNDGSDKPVAYKLNVDKAAQTYQVEILRGQAALDSQPEQGTMRGATLSCIYCETPLERERIVEGAQAGLMGQHLLMVVLGREGQTGRDFRTPSDIDRMAYINAEKKLERLKDEGDGFWGEERLLSVIPDEPTPPDRARSVSIRSYGIEQWGQMFNSRQLLTLLTFGQQIRTVREMLALENFDYAKVIALYLEFVLAKMLSHGSTMAWWQPNGLKVAPTMARHDIQMTWDYAEGNPFSGYATSWKSFINALWRTIENLINVEKPGVVKLGSATQLRKDWTGKFDAVICDPPYYDSVTYADLSDYFYPWHKRVVGDDYPEAFVTEVTPKDEELVQEAVYHGGSKSTAQKHYEDGMAQAFKEMQRVLCKDGIAVIMFAHKQSSAWETLVGALIRAGFQVTASWPLNTEGRRLQSYRAVALASSVYLVCRKRNSDTGTGYLEDIQAELRKTIRRYLERFWEAGIGGADFFMSAIGPGLSVFSRYKRVERYDGSQVTISDFLDLVRHEVASFAIERIVGLEDFSDRLDQPTQFYVLWRWGYNDWDVPDGEVLLLSTAVGIDLKVLMERIGLIAKVKGKLRLLGPQERSEKLERLTERVVAGGAVPLVDVLHKACLLWEKDAQDELSALVAARGGELWPVAQAMVYLLPPDNFERKALLSMLGNRGDLESRAQTWVNQHPAPPPKPRQLNLFDEET
jgi:adenine-specific DNA methylase